jgi:MFS family permease
MQPLTYKQQLFCVFNISFAFLLMFIAYSPLENIITKIYRDMGYEYFGQVSIAIVYLCFGFSTALSSTIIKLLGYKMVFIAGAICYTLFDASGLIVSYVISSKIMAWLTVIFSCSLCGLSAGCIWVAQGAYIGNISSL